MEKAVFHCPCVHYDQIILEKQGIFKRKQPNQLCFQSGKRILIYCRSGNRSKQAADKLVALGYTNIVEFGGISSWPGETVAGSE